MTPEFTIISEYYKNIKSTTSILSIDGNITSTVYCANPSDYKIFNEFPLLTKMTNATFVVSANKHFIYLYSFIIPDPELQLKIGKWCKENISNTINFDFWKIIKSRYHNYALPCMVLSTDNITDAVAIKLRWL